MDRSWDNLKPVQTMNYCKADLKSGKPLIVIDLINNTKTNTNKWSFEGYDKNMNPIKFECEYVKDKKDQSGAKAKLVWWS